MPVKKREKKTTESFTDLDGYEKWLEKQPVTSVKARSGFISEEVEETVQ